MFTISKRFAEFLLLLSFAFSSVTAQSSMKILLVLDQDYKPERDSVIEKAVRDAGYSFAEYFTHDSASSPSRELMNNYNLVLWYTANDGTGAYLWNGNDSDNEDLKQYLDDGGMLWIAGNDFLYDRYGKAPNQFSTGDFVHDYLGIKSYDAQSYAGDGSNGVPLMYGIPDNGIFREDTIRWKYATLWYADACTPVSEAKGVLAMGPASYTFYGDYSSLYYEKDFSKVLTTFFDPYYIDTDSARAEFFKSALDFFSDTLEIQVTFRVDMSVQAGKGNFNPATDTLVLAGSFNNWLNEPPSNTEKIMDDPDGDLIYTKTIALKQYTDYQYKFNIGLTWEGRDEIPGQNRSLTTGANDTLLAVVYYNNETPSITPSADTIIVSVDSVNARQGDIVSVPVNVTFPGGKNYDSAELNFGGYSDGLNYMGIDTARTLLGSYGWTYSANEKNGLILTASAGARDISGSGVLFALKFMVTKDTCAFVHVNITRALFNTGGDSVIIENGGVSVTPVPDYGDVDENGYVQAHDAALILKHVVAMDTLTCKGSLNADVTGDGSVSALDASVIEMYLVSLVDSLPYDTSSHALVPTGTVVLNNTAVRNGEVVVPLILSNGSNIFSFQGEISYDPNRLEFEKIIWTNALSKFLILQNQAKGNVKFAGASSTSNGKEEIFAQVKFKVKILKDGRTKIELRNFRFNEGKFFNTEAFVKIITEADKNSLPAEFALKQNYPNPFNPTTVIPYELPQAGQVKLVILNPLGQIVKTLINGWQTAGRHQVVWDGRSASGQLLSSGIYFYCLKTGSFKQTRKMILIR
jgi:hypothetical protein